jgi:hypothetical protein
MMNVNRVILGRDQVYPAWFATPMMILRALRLVLEVD